MSASNGLGKSRFGCASPAGYKREDFRADFFSLFSDLWLKTTEGAKAPAAAAATMAAAAAKIWVLLSLTLRRA